jgi:hypothetical protein
MRINLMHQRPGGCDDCPCCNTDCNNGACWGDSLTPGVVLEPVLNDYWWSEVRVLILDEGQLVGKFYYWDHYNNEEKIEYSTISLDTILAAILHEEIKIKKP